MKNESILKVQINSEPFEMTLHHETFLEDNLTGNCSHPPLPESHKLHVIIFPTKNPFIKPILQLSNNYSTHNHRMLLYQLF